MKALAPLRRLIAMSIDMGRDQGIRPGLFCALSGLAFYGMRAPDPLGSGKNQNNTTMARVEIHAWRPRTFPGSHCLMRLWPKRPCRCPALVAGRDKEERRALLFITELPRENNGQRFLTVKPSR